jgi:CRISPR-associated protein Csb2
MPFVIVADLPLGTYRGASQDGQPEPMPSIARLHSALLCAAGFGPRATGTADGSLDVSEADELALRWLEENPPDSVRIPALDVSISPGTAYRSDGTIKRAKSGATIKKLAKAPVSGAAVSGSFAWIWHEPPPGPVRASIEQLCPDVAYLGTSESPVRLAAGTGDEFDATADLDAGAGMFSLGVIPVQHPMPGRTGELAAAHRAVTGKPPSAARDRIGTDEKSLSPVPRRAAVATIRYRARTSPAQPSPWPLAIVAPLSRHIPAGNRVRWAVAAHRALVQLIGFGAPPLITGAYPPGMARPANRLALQILDSRMPSVAAIPSPAQSRVSSALVLLVPTDAGSADLGVLQRAVAALTSVRGPGGDLARVDQARVQVLNGADFWDPPAPGCVRLWRTEPAAVPDTRGCDGWTFADAALLSLGFVWKDFLPDAGSRGEDYFRALAIAASDRGAAVVHARAVRSGDAHRYAHKVHEHAVVRPYTAVLGLGHLAGPRVVQAIGQSRHLGGGLLVPFDVAEGTAAGDVVLPAYLTDEQPGDHRETR